MIQSCKIVQLVNKIIKNKKNSSMKASKHAPVKDFGDLPCAGLGVEIHVKNKIIIKMFLI